MISSMNEHSQGRLLKTELHPFCFHSLILNSFYVTCHSSDEIQILFGNKKNKEIISILLTSS